MRQCSFSYGQVYLHNCKTTSVKYTNACKSHAHFIKSKEKTIPHRSTIKVSMQKFPWFPFLRNQISTNDARVVFYSCVVWHICGMRCKPCPGQKQVGVGKKGKGPNGKSIKMVENLWLAHLLRHSCKVRLEQLNSRLEYSFFWIHVLLLLSPQFHLTDRSRTKLHTTFIVWLDFDLRRTSALQTHLCLWFLM